MSLLRKPRIALALGAFMIFLLAVIGGRMTGADIAATLSQRADAAIEQAGGGGQVKARFSSPNGLPSRHPVLSGGEPLSEATRARIARAVGNTKGVGGVRWADGNMLTEAEVQAVKPLHCQEDVDALLRARTIRFEESSARIDAASAELIDEVATALRPCLGSIISITGHTDSSGPEPGNLELSQVRAEAVRSELVRRGIPEDGLRVRGIGSRDPVEGLDPADPANRRIEFAVIATEPIRPTPVDTPGPH
ncbi:hypothetical protein GCM10009127_14230 [Alteraurantiacibacter aestuarii]|uniref:OmpA family protein n=1 Tax=Alteraurantiacibacter aestuarii TaxID=650004 RepID=A0A844ZQV6_9SPHN|nr:OmpA family protein [Alteraurantiacibacter aestuarii]MXO87989.1 OmpA family protein [Alteraurantiacibacter aestuarii]